MDIKSKAIYALTAATFILSTPVFAGTLNGQVAVQLTLSTGCTVSNGSSANGVNHWGTLDFGNYADLSNAIDGSVTGTGGNGVSIICSEGLTPTLALNGGLSANQGVRNMTANGGNIAYRLYSDTARTQAIAINGQIPLAADGTAQNIPIYGRVLPADQTTPAPAAGTYNDTVVATLAW
ncbi:Spore coat protein U [[Pantoea] beijingensis]|uniref:Spore coat protein U n=1 Tax=[Pantoea] beijingensis TaxID=1324864 RepID=A0A443IDR1_9GAMM|nr:MULTISPECIES: spore coat U domain-containing protein [Erwiniaceae]RWR02342.1 Spore coat protein U [[Pantoea] beijingensis]